MEQRNGRPSPSGRRTTSALPEFRGLYDFDLDDFQVQACQALEEGAGVLVAAPTGAGKTIVGEFAVHLALLEGRKCFYTAPIKALSNQKFHDLVERYGADKVGLLTGDNTVNGEAPVVVMTTEVLRNMLYAGSHTLEGLAYVVMDEVHYLADRFRGAVWEEVIIHLPEHVAVVALSATVSNAEEFGEWLGEVRGDTRVVVEEHRPVPLWQHVMAGDRLHDLFVDDAQQQVNPELVRLAREDERIARMGGGDYRSGGPRPQRGGRRPRNVNIPMRFEVIERLNRDRLLPAITFIFSRVGCDAAVDQCLAAGLRLTSNEERLRIRGIVERALRRPAGGGPRRPRLPRLARRSRTRVRRPPRRACSPRSRRRWRRCSSRAWSGRCSRPRPWPWASTCRRARSSSRSS